MFPSSHILLVRGMLVDMTMRTFPQIRRRLAPALRAISKVVGSKAPKNPHSSYDSSTNDILLHIFSHGGSSSAIQLCISYHLLTSDTLPLKLVVFDSCPGDASFSKAYSAAVLSLPQKPWPLLMGGKLILYPFVGGITALQNLGLLASVKQLREELNSEDVFGSVAKRLYLVSKKDVMVDWRDAVGHAEEARSKDYAVDVIAFEDGEHCGLVIDDMQRERYWQAIQDCWLEKSVDAAGKKSEKAKLPCLEPRNSKL